MKLISRRTFFCGFLVVGSWYDPGYDVRIESQKPYTGASRTTGFRVVAKVVPSENEWLKVPKRK